MIVRAVKSPLVTSKSHQLTDLLWQALPAILPEATVVVVSSKIVSLCEGRILPVIGTDREKLIAEQSDYYLPPTFSQYGHHFSIVGGTLVGSAGIDTSNGNGQYILWPADPQRTANYLRQWLKTAFGLENVGVVITDSISTPMRLGAIGAALAFSGFGPLKSYVGKEDLFGQKLKLERADILSGLAATAVLAMGEGAEQTPIVLISDLPSLDFVDRDPTNDELKTLNLTFAEDLFAPFLTSAAWQKGHRLSPAK